MAAFERVQVPAIRWSAGLMVPVVDEDGEVYVAEPSGCLWFRDGAHVRAFVDDCAPGDVEDIEASTPGWAAAHLALADLIDELQKGQGNG
jgi:hypothetical protein